MMTNVLYDHYFDCQFIEEPLLIFGEGAMHVDPKKGLAQFGPCVLPDQRPKIPLSIGVGVIGTGFTIGLAEKWLEKCRTGVEGAVEEPILRPSFPGFQAVFGCEIVLLKQWKEIIPEERIKEVIYIPQFGERVRQAVKLFTDRLKNLAEREPRPQVVICALPQDIVDYCATKRGGRERLTPKERQLKRIIDYHRRVGQQTLFPIDEIELGLADFLPEASDFRRILKAEAMKIGIPTQLARPSTFVDTPKLQGVQESRTLQDVATRAWNFSVALYYKGGGFPWRLADAQHGTCYIGISFFKEYAKRDNRMRVSLAQIFTHTGEGLILRGDRFEWDETYGKTPHLSEGVAYKLLSDALELYNRHMGQLPSRLVIHKSSRYWPEELEGFKKAAKNIGKVDFIAFGERGIRFLRKGRYPPLRGTVVKLGPNNYLLYTRGYIPYLKTYPGKRIPAPVEILEHYGDLDPKTVCQEILALTKMNWNSADYCIREPITLQFAREVGRILAYLAEEVTPRPQYMFYM
jgi:hypothetical protein